MKSGSVEVFERVGRAPRVHARSAAGVLVAFALSAAGCSKEESSAVCGDCEAPSFCSASGCVPPGTAVLTGPIGTGPGQFQVEDPEEANPVGPLSLAAAADAASVLVLDQLNHRVQVFEASRWVRDIPIPSGSADDLALLESGQLVLLDRQSDQLMLLDGAGQQQASVAVTGAGIESAYSAEGLFVRPDGVWVQVDQLGVLVLDAQGGAVARRRVVPGLPSKDGRNLLSLRRLGDGSLHLVVRPAQGLPTYQERQLSFAHPAAHVLGFDTDMDNNVYIATQHYWDEAGTAREEPRLTVLSPALAEVRQQLLEPYATPRQIFRSIEVTPRGAVFQLDVQEDQLSVRRY